MNGYNNLSLRATDSLRHDRLYQIEKRALEKAFDSLRRTIEILKRFNITLGEKHPSVGHGNFIISFIPTQRLNTLTTQHLDSKYFHTLWCRCTAWRSIKEKENNCEI